MPSFLERYLQGEHEQVWNELLALGGQVRQEPLYVDALAVARETMRRARYNIELLVPRLRACGYQFGYAWVTEQQGYDIDLVVSVAQLEARQPSVPWRPPSPDVHKRLAELEQAVGGPIPLSLRAWYEVVGEVNFVGELPAQWGFMPGTIGFNQSQRALLCSDEFRDFGRDKEIQKEDYWADDSAFFKKYPMFKPLDALYVFSIEEASDEMGGQIAHRQYYPRLFVSIAPDFAFKYWEAGGGRYRIYVPNAAIDGKLEVEWHGLTFVNYLRLCFRWAGLPELAYFEREEGQAALRKLTEGLLPL